MGVLHLCSATSGKESLGASCVFKSFPTGFLTVNYSHSTRGIAHVAISILQVSHESYILTFLNKLTHIRIKHIHKQEKPPFNFFFKKNPCNLHATQHIT